MSGQSVIDRINAAKHSIAGQGLAKSVCKSTTEELLGPKRKHLDYLLQCTNEPNVSIPQMADMLIERTQSANWIVTLKSLITIHNVMNYGNERFCQYLASSNCSLSLDNFSDRSHPQGYEMSNFVKKYAKYVHEKAVSYRTMAYDFCKVKRGKEDGLLRTMAIEKLLKALPTLQKQVDVLLEFDATPNDLANNVINAAFLLMFKDLIRLFACYNDGVINLLEKYFDMNKKQCKEALDLYKKFLVRMDKTSEFLKVAESVGIDRGDIPDLAKAPASLLEALEAHLASIEGKKSSGSSLTTSGSSLLSSATRPSGGLSEEDKRRIIDEENKELAKLKEQKVRQQEVKPTAAASLTAAAVVASLDARQVPSVAATTSSASTSPSAAGAHKPSEDLLALDDVNPFKAKVQSVLAAQQTLFLQQQTVAPQLASAWAATASPTAQPAAPMPGAFGLMPAQHNGSMRNGGFSSEPNFAAAFGGGTQQRGSSDSLMLVPTQVGSLHQAAPGTDLFGEVLQPQKSAQEAAKNQKFVVQGDLDSSLANLAGNLSVGPSQHKRSDFQWSSQPQEKKLTGGNSFQGIQPAAATSTWVQPQHVPAAPVAVVAQTYQHPAMYGVPQPYGGGSVAVGSGGMFVVQHAPAGQFGVFPVQQQQSALQLRPQAAFTRDPFGAL